MRGNVSEARISPFWEWWDHTFGRWLNLAAYWRERRAILDEPQITISGSGLLGSGPFKFALQSLVLVPLLTSVMSSTVSYFSEIPPEFTKKLVDEIDELEHKGLAPPASQRKAAPVFGVETNSTRHEALKVFVRARDQSQKLLPFLLSLSILLSASLFKMSFRRWRKSFPLLWQADRAYLYYVGARLFVPITIFGLLSYLVELSGRYAMATSGALVPGFYPYLPYAGLIWLFVKFLLAIWVFTALWSSASILSRVLAIHGERNGRLVKGRRAVALRMFAAQIIALFFVRFLESVTLFGYYALHV